MFLSPVGVVQVWRALLGERPGRRQSSSIPRKRGARAQRPSSNACQLMNSLLIYIVGPTLVVVNELPGEQLCDNRRYPSPEN